MSHTNTRVVLAVGLLLGSLTAQRLWLFHQGEAALWSDAAATSHAPRPLINLGNALSDAGEYAGAERAYRQALTYADARRSPSEWRVGGAMAEADLSWLLRREGFTNESAHLIALANDRWPDSREIHQRFLER